MVRNASFAMLVLMAFSLMAPLAMAQQDAPANEHDVAAAKETAKGNTSMYAAVALGLGMALAAFGGAMGQGKAIAAAVESMARQPEAAPRIQTAMIIGLALIETLVIYMLLICLMNFPS